MWSAGQEDIPSAPAPRHIGVQPHDLQPVSIPFSKSADKLLHGASKEQLTLPTKCCDYVSINIKGVT